MNGEVFERELEVGLALLRGDPVPSRVVGAQASRRSDLGRWLVAALLCVGAGVVVAVAAWPWADDARTAAQDPMEVSDTQIREWVAALAKPGTAPAAARQLVLHARRAMPFLSKGLAETEARGHQVQILSVLAGCRTAAGEAVRVLRTSQEALPIDLAPVAGWAAAQLVPHTDLPVSEIAPLFQLTEYKGRAIRGPTWSVRYRTNFQARRFHSRATLRQRASVLDLLVAVEATNPQLRELAAELLSLRGEEARSTVGALARRIAPGAISKVFDPRGDGHRAFDVGNSALALWVGIDRAPFVALPGGMLSAFAPGNGDATFYVGPESSIAMGWQGREDQLHLPEDIGEAASVLELVHCARALVAIAPDDPRTRRARVLLALSPLETKERVTHLEALRRWGAADLRPFAPQLVHLVTVRDVPISRAAADLLSIAWSDGDLTAAESTLLQRAIDRPTDDAYLRAVLQRIRDR